VTVASAPPREYAAGPGDEPALRGPTLRSPISSTSAIEPPPAPISISSMVEMRIGRPLPSMKRFWRAASKLYAVSGSPPSTSESFAVVPPMSNARRFPPLSSRPKKAAARAPAAGPDSSIPTGVRRASAAWVSPPLESIRRSGAGIPRSTSLRAITSR